MKVKIKKSVASLNAKQRIQLGEGKDAVVFPVGQEVEVSQEQYDVIKAMPGVTVKEVKEETPAEKKAREKAEAEDAAENTTMTKEG